MLQSNKINISIVIGAVLLSILIVILTFTRQLNNDPITVYTVYLDGKNIGTIASKDDFEDFVNTKEQQLKQKYNVDTVYTPNGVEIKKNVTYNPNIKSDEEIYNKIISDKNFTVHGYLITITSIDEEGNKNSININVLNKEIFDTAVENTIKAFVDEEQYQKFIEGTQEEVKDSGSMIENIDLLEEVTYKEMLISTEEKIFTDADELSKYLLYGTLDDQQTYTVKADDTIETIANEHKLNVKEFLIANPDFTSENNLLYENQKVNVGLIDPLISVAVDIHSVGDEERSYDTEVQYDSSQYIGYQEVIKEGENGLYKVTRKSQYVNGQLTSGTITNSTEIKPSVNKIILKGEKYAPNIADLSYWAWPTEKPYTITSYFEYRWGSFHNGIDIYVGYGSPIYAANNGVVAEAKSGCYAGNLSCNGRQGNYVLINHNAGGYYTVYMHMKEIYVTAGQTVARGQKIGAMGNSGEVYPVPSSSNPYGGTHLHFGVRMYAPYGNHINPLSLF